MSMCLCSGTDAIYMRLQVIMRIAGPILSFSQPCGLEESISMIANFEPLHAARVS